MRSREEFGKYLLLKKLSEDPLGETFRAGRVAGGSVEQVVLLRVFNGRNLDSARLWQRISGRGPVQAALKNPNVGNGVDLGEERGVPYAAYDYISGRNLENLLIQASNTNSPIPVDHALLIAERTSLALAAAAETRAGDSRVLHGFAVPHLVMVSNEGETRVLGFEAAPGLAEQAGSLPGEITRYLAPEAVAGQAVERSDDAFTLGAILWELLACKPLPKAGAGGYAAVIDGAQVAYDGSAFPAEIAALLKRSLVPRGQRIADAAAWHKALSQLMADAGFAATTFNLAFFMHNLFRQEIEEENREIEEEKSIEVAAPAAAAAAPGVGAAAAAAAPGEAPPMPPPAAEEVPARGGKGLWAALAAVLLVAALLAGWFFWLQPAREAEAEAARQAAEAAQAQESVVEEPPEPQGPTPEELQAQITEMLESRSAQMEEKLVGQYDDQIRQLQEQLVEARDAAQRAAEERERQRIAAESEAKEEAERLAAEEDARVAAEAEARQKAEAERKAKEAEAEAARLAEAQAEPEPPPVKVGDLVGMSSGVTPPELLAQPEVRYPAMGKKLAKEAEVEVRVLVDENGNVRDATLMGKKAGFGFDQAALEAARNARYKPALKEGVRVKMYVNLTIKFDL
jgi:TonB family protein